MIYIRLAAVYRVSSKQKPAKHPPRRLEVRSADSADDAMGCVGVSTEPIAGNGVQPST